jgi:hypothetical protein
MKRAIILVAFTAVSVLFAGCALSRSGEQAGTQFPIEIVPSHPASISAAKVVQEGDAVVVSGTIRKSHEFHLPGKVQMVACGKDARPLAEAQPQITGYASKRGGIKEARFSARLQAVPPPDAFFRLRYAAPCAQEEGLSCL